MSDHENGVRQIVRDILHDKCLPFPPADHITDVLLRELPKHGLTIVGTGALKPRPTPPSTS